MFEDNSATRNEITLNFDKLPRNCPKPNLTDDQKRVIARNLPQLQPIIHYIFWSNARFNGKEGYTFLTVLTGNMITLFVDEGFRLKSSGSAKDLKKSKSKEKIKAEMSVRQDNPCKIKKFGKSINLEFLKQIGYDLKSKEVLIRAQIKQKEKNDESEAGKKTMNKINIHYLVDEGNGFNLAFAQCVYRNFYFNYSVLGRGEFVEVLTDSNEFPILNVHLSPSQCFQFFYHAKCVENEFEYSQQVVQYIHSLVLLGMPIVDISKLPLFSQKSQSSEKNNMLEPVFQALSDQDFVCGICCSDKNPNLMDSLDHVFHKSSKINLLHLDNCGMKNGIKNLFRKVQKHGSNICYWNLRHNNFGDMKYFINILEDPKATENLLFLDLSYCKLNDDFMEKLYKALTKYTKLQQLYIAGSSNKNKSVTEAFDDLLTQYESSGHINLRTLDLSEIESVDSYLKVLNKHRVHLRSLKLRKIDLNNNTFDELTTFIAKSSNLRSLDLSELDNSKRFLEKVLYELYKNEKLTDFDLILNKLKNRKMVPIISALIKGPTLESKWNSLHLDSNNLTGDDLKNITPLLKMMNVSFLSMNDNFQYDPEKKDNDKIDEIICKTIRECISLEKLHIKGEGKHKLGPKINEVLKAISSSAIREIDFRNNNAGDDFFSILQTVIKERNNEDDPESVPLSHISIDGNGLTSIKTLEDISKLIEQRKVLKFDFPEEDCKKIYDNCKEPKIKPKLREQISNVKIAVVSAVHKNRASKRMFPDLPFDTTREMRNLIQRMTKELREKIRNEEPLKHTEFCEELGLPLPYQNMGDIVRDGGKEFTDEENNSLCEFYHCEGLSKYIEENDQYGLFSQQEDQDFRADNFDEEEDTEIFYSDNIEEEEEEAENDHEERERKHREEEEEEERKQREKEEERKRKQKEAERRRLEEEEEAERRRLEEEEEAERRRSEEEEEAERRRFEEEERERLRKQKERKKKEAERRRHEEEEEEERERIRKQKERKKQKEAERRRLEEEEEERERIRRRKERKKREAERRRLEEEEEERERIRKRKERKKREAERRRHEEEEEELEKRRRKKEEEEKRKQSSSKRRDEDFGFSNSDDDSDNDQYSPTRSRRKRIEKQETDDERPSSIVKNKKGQRNDDEESNSLDEDKNMMNDDQERQMNDDMNNLILTTSQNFGNFKIPNFSKSQKGKRQTSQKDSMYMSQRKPNLRH